MPSTDVLAHVVDVHCHPTDSVTPQSFMESLPVKICAMATKESDQPLVRNLASSWPEKVVPCFGYHPWFTHWICVEPIVSKEHHYKTLLSDASRPWTNEMNEAFNQLLPDLPQPVLLSEILTTLRTNLMDFPHAMLGEVGIDRAFRIPFPQNATGERRKLSDFSVPLDHQIHILESQLQLAVELRRNVSLHSVKAQQTTLQLVDRMSKKYGTTWDMISIDMHSCGLSPEMWTALQKAHPNIYLSLSTAINARSRSYKELIAACNADRILAESDYHDVHESAERTWEMCTIIAEVKGWTIEDYWDPTATEDRWGVVRKLEENWMAFSRGNHVKQRQDMEARNRPRRVRKDTTWDIDAEETDD